MRKILIVAAAAVAFWAMPASEANAHPPWGFGGYYNPYPPAVYSYRYNTYATPYGYRGFNNQAIVASPFGFSTFSNYGSYARPIYSGPVHSIYHDPFNNTFIYGSGYRNSPPPTFSSFYFGW